MTSTSCESPYLPRSPKHGLLWQQLPVHSPMPFGAVWEVMRHRSRSEEDPRRRVRAILRETFKADEVVLLGSGTQALQVAIGAAARIVGDLTVALPAFSCFDVASAAVGAGARITLYDVEPSTLAPDLESLAAALAGGARIVVAAPLFGIPIDWERLQELTAASGAVLIEDAAQGHGAYWRDRPLGGIGVISTLSFGRGKGWTGEKGGALLGRVPEGSLGASVREAGAFAELGVFFRASAHAVLGRPARYRLPASIPWLALGETRYHDPQLPAGMTRSAAALLDRTRELAAREALARRANAQRLLRQLPARPPMRAVRAPPQSTPGYLRLPLLVSRGLDGFRDRSHAMKLGVMASYPSSLADLPAVRARLVRNTGRWPGANELVRQLITLPTHSFVTRGDRDALVRLLTDYAG